MKKSSVEKTKVLFVCTGNTCRSPMAEIIFKNLCKSHKRTGVMVRSAGTDADIGKDLSPYAIIALQNNGEKVPIKPHRARQYKETMQKEYNYILSLNSIEDPYGRGQEAYDRVCQKLQAESRDLYNKIFKL